MKRTKMAPAHPAWTIGLLASVAWALPTNAEQAPASSSLDTVVITAEGLEQQLEAQQALTPGAVTVVDGDELYQRNVGNLADMLRYVPGVWTESSSGADDVFFSSRGSNLDATDYDKNGIKLLQDGLPVTTADGNNHNRVLDPLSARYAVIAHGANALTYGASTLGGAIDFTSPTARNSSPLALFLNGGSNGQANARVSAGTVSGAFDGLMTLETRNWGGYRAHSEQHRESVYVNGGWRWSETATTRLFATYVDSDEELPGALTRAAMAADRDQASAPALGGNYQKNVRTWRVAGKTSWRLGENATLDFGLSYEEQSLYHPIVDKVLVDFDGPGPAPPVEVFSLLVDTDHRDAGAMLRYNLRVGDHDLLAGVNYGDGAVRGGNYRNDGGRRNGLSERVRDDSDSFEGYVVDRWRFVPEWTLVYGAQFVHAGRNVRTTDAASGSVRNPKDGYSAFNPRIGLIRALGERTEIFGSVSRLFEAPTTFELEDDVRGNDSTLDAMHGTVYEVGVRGSAAQAEGTRWHWDVSAYYARIRDEILSVDDPAAPGNSLSANIDRTRHAGIEALIGASFVLGSDMHRLEPLISATLNDFHFDSDPAYGNDDLPAAPKYAVRGELLYRHRSGFHAGPTFDLIGRRYADFANTYEVGSYALLGLRGGLSRGRWELFGELRNLTDRRYVSTLTVLNEAAADAAVLYPGTPRAIYVGGRYQL